MSIEYTDFYDNEDIDHITESIETDENDYIVEENKEENIEELEEAPTLMGKVDNADKVYVRSAPNRNADPVTHLNKGTELLITGTAEDIDGGTWYEITTATSIDGYIMSDFVTIES